MKKFKQLASEHKAAAVVLLAAMFAMLLIAAGNFPAFTGYFFGNGAGISNLNLVLPHYSNTVFLATNGNDTTAAIGRPDLPCLTFNKANQLAFNNGPGTLISVASGNYTNNNLLTNGVNYFFGVGARVYWRPPSTNTVTDYYAIFDDRPCGPTTNIITGYGWFQWSGWTNGLYGTTFKSGGSNQTAGGMTGGVLIITNATSYISLTADSCQSSSWVELGSAAITAQSGTLFANINTLVDPAADTNLSFTNFINHNNINKISSCAGVVWNTGIQHIYCRSNNMGCPGTQGSGYALWGNGFANTDVGDFYYDGDLIGGKIYLSLQTTNSVWWVHCKHLENLHTTGSATEQNALTLFGDQRGYLYADKVASRPGIPGIAVIDSSVQSATSNVLFWGYIGKLVCSNVLFNCNSGGTIFIHALQVEDLGGGTATNINQNNVNTFLLSYMPGYTKMGQFWLTNPIVNGTFFTNFTSVAGTLTVDYTLPSATASLGITNLTSGEWFNGTNDVGSHRASFKLQQMDIIEFTNKNGAGPTIDASRFTPIN